MTGKHANNGSTGKFPTELSQLPVRTANVNNLNPYVLDILYELFDVNRLRGCLLYTLISEDCKTYRVDSPKSPS